MPVQVSWPAPKRRPAARLSLPIHIIHVATHNVLLYVPTTLCRGTKRRPIVEGLCAGADLVAVANESALGPSLIADTYNKRRGTQRSRYVATPL